MKEIIAVVLTALILTACGGAEEPVAAPTPTAEATPTPTPTPETQYESVQVLYDNWESWDKSERRQYCEEVEDGTPAAEARWWDSDAAEDQYGFRIESGVEDFVVESCGDKDGDNVINAQDAYPNNGDFHDPVTVTIKCGKVGKFTIDRLKPDFSEAWSAKFPRGFMLCDSTGLDPKTPVTEIEESWFDGEYDAIPYEQCVEHGTDWSSNKWPVSTNQNGEAETALSLCPNHPDADAIRARIAQQDVEAQLEKDGRLFGSGVHRVGKDIQPGSYVTTNVEDCYWERQDQAGAIIDNYFGTALRVEVYIDPSDYGFLSRDCGTWKPL